MFILVYCCNSKIWGEGIVYRYRKNNKANDDKGDVVTPPETVPPLLREHVRRRIMKMELALQKTQSSYRIGHTRRKPKSIKKPNKTGK